MPVRPTVTNTSCLIAFDRIGQLGLLDQLYNPVVASTAVANEWGVAVAPAWLQIEAVQNVSLVQSLVPGLGLGEAETIALGIEVSAIQVILDEKRARRVAKQLGLPLSGTLAVVLHAKDRGIISAVRPMLEDLRNTGFYVSDGLFQQTLRTAGE